MKVPALYPALLLAGGVVLSSLLAVQQSDWLVFAAPVSLALCTLVADALDTRLRGGPASPSAGAQILAASFLLAGLLLASQDRALLKEMMPLLGATAAVATLRPRARRRHCPP